MKMTVVLGWFSEPVSEWVSEQLLGSIWPLHHYTTMMSVVNKNKNGGNNHNQNYNAMPTGILG